LQGVFAARKNDEIFCPTDFSNQWLEFWQLQIFAIKLAHQPKILSRESIPARKLGLKIAGQSFHNRFTPTQLFLFTVNGLSDFQVKRQQLVVDRPQRLVLALADRCREQRKELRIFWRRDFHRQKGTNHTEFLSAKSHEAGTKKISKNKTKLSNFHLYVELFCLLNRC
jgi:hypothetical protein